jgi:hypothetical protein
MEQLVKKSLAVNPNLSHGQEFPEFMNDLRRQAGGPGDKEGRPPRDKREQRAQMVTFFLAQKVQEFLESAEEVDRRIAELQQERDRLRVDSVDDVIEFLVVFSRQKDFDLQDALRGHRPMLTQLGLTEEELVALVSSVVKR